MVVLVDAFPLVPQFCQVVLSRRGMKALTQTALRCFVKAEGNVREGSHAESQ